MVQLRKDDTGSVAAPKDHPLFNGATTVGMISGENPKFPGQASGHEALGEQLRQMGLRCEPRDGRYGAPEKSWMVYGPTREQMYQLGKGFGQESVVYSQGGKHELLYTNGPNTGRYHPALDHEWFQTPPEDYYTHMPELGGYLRLNFDWNTLNPSNLAQPAAVDALNSRASHGVPQAPAEQTMGKAEIAQAILTTLKKFVGDAPARPHPHAYEWHNEHTDHHLHVMSPGVVLRSAGELEKGEARNGNVKCGVCGHFKAAHTATKSGRSGPMLDGCGIKDCEPHEFKTHAQLRREKNEKRHEALLTAMRREHGLVKSLRERALRKSDPTKPHPHMDGSKPPEAIVAPAATQQHQNDQAAGVGVSTYAKYAMPYGRIDKTQKPDLFHYPYQGKAQEVNSLIKDHGYTVYYAGGKYGRPDLANRNYNTKHLMIYDPSPGSGGDFGTEEYTDNWRKVHELAHALVYPELNQIYGEGRRIGKLGQHRTLREAMRAVHWEWLAAHKQRELSKMVGVEIPDPTFHKELNTVMHDAIHRAVTGKFTEPSGEGYHPHDHLVPLETALGMVREAGHNLGLTGMHDLIRKSEESMTDKYHYYLVHKETGKIHGGYEFKDDANDAAKDQGSHIKVSHRSKVDHAAKEAFHRENKIMSKLHKNEDQQEYEPEEWRQELAKAIRNRVDAYSRSLLELRQRELKKNAGTMIPPEPGVHEAAPEMTPMDKCPLCSMPDVPGQCKCLQGPLSKSAKISAGKRDFLIGAAEGMSGEFGTCVRCNAKRGTYNAFNPETGEEEKGKAACGPCYKKDLARAKQKPAATKKSEMCKSCGKDHGMAKCGLDEIKPGPALGKQELKTKPKEPVKTQEGSGGKITKGPKLGKNAMGMGGASAAPKPAMPKPAAPAAAPKPAAAAAPSPAAPKMPKAPAAPSGAPGGVAKSEELAKTGMTGMRGMPKDMQSMASAQAAKDAATKPAAAAPAPKVKLPGAAEQMSRAASFAEFTPPAQYVGHQTMGSKVPPAGTAHLKAPPAAAKPTSAGPVMNAARPQKPGIFGRLAAKLGKSEDEPNELKKSLGKCALCSKPEHPGTCS